MQLILRGYYSTHSSLQQLILRSNNCAAADLESPAALKDCAHMPKESATFERFLKLC